MRLTVAGSGSAHSDLQPADEAGIGADVINVNDESMKILEATPTIIQILARDFDAEGWRRRPAPGEWSALEIAVHLKDVESHTVDRVRRVLAEDQPELPAWDHEVPPARAYDEGADPELALREHADLRTEHLRLLHGLSEQQWQRSARHETHGEITLTKLEAHVAAEEVDHLAQLARLR